MKYVIILENRRGFIDAVARNSDTSYEETRDLYYSFGYENVSETDVGEIRVVVLKEGKA